MGWLTNALQTAIFLCKSRQITVSWKVQDYQKTTSPLFYMADTEDDGYIVWCRKNTINYHIKKIFEDEDSKSQEDAVIRKFRITDPDGKVTIQIIILWKWLLRLGLRPIPSVRWSSVNGWIRLQKTIPSKVG